MARVAYDLTIHAPIALVYQISQDYAVRYEWDPFPESIRLLNGAQQIEIGTQVAVTAKSGLYMEVEYVQVKPPSTAAIKMTRGPRILSAFSGSWLFKSVTNNQTHAKFVYSIKTSWWTIPWVSEWIAQRYFSKLVQARLDGLKTYCEIRAGNVV